MKLYPVPAAEMQNQSAQWLNVRRDRPDWMIMWGWGAMNPTAVKEAAKINYPMDKFVGVWWSRRRGRRTADRRRGARAITSLDLQRSGRELPGDPGHRETRVDKGKSQTAKDKVGENLLQPRRLQLPMLIAEAIRNAQRITGKKVGDRRGRAARA